VACFLGAFEDRSLGQLRLKISRRLLITARACRLIGCLDLRTYNETAVDDKLFPMYCGLYYQCLGSGKSEV
jgi:hypothetical protein